MKSFLIYLLVFGAATFVCCQKQNEWLDVKRNLSDVSPQTINDMQAILDNTNSFNSSYPMLGLLGTDNLYMSEENLGAAGQIERNAYLWAKDIFQTSTVVEFSSPYIRIAAINVVLEGLDKLPVTEPGHSNVRGQALFHRAMAYYGLAQLFCKPYQRQSARLDPGLQLRRTADPNLIVKRSSVEDTYRFILTDLEDALPLLPERAAFVTRPGKQACRGLMAKVYLAMKDYENAAKMSAEAIGEQPVLLDFNSGLIKPEQTYVFPAYSNQHLNPEVIFFAYAQTWGTMWPVLGTAFVDSSLFASYQADDLRAALFFRKNAQGRPQFTGSYSGTNRNFAGIAVNELLLIEAESLARTGRGAKAIELLNDLLAKRFRSGQFSPYDFSGEQQAINTIMEERRKELPFTGQLRWEDLRRLEPQRPIVHIYQGTRYELAAGDAKWVFPLPIQEVSLSQVEQNLR